MNIEKNIPGIPVKKLTFIIPGRPVPYTRTTQRGKWISKPFGRYLDYCREVQNSFSTAILELMSKSMENLGRTGITLSKESSTRSKGTLTKTIEEQENLGSCFVKVTIEAIENEIVSPISNKKDK